MATYNLDLVANALKLDIRKLQNALRAERHYDVKQIAGLAVGDMAYFDIAIPEWCRTVCVSKRTDTANADTVSVAAQELGLAIQPVLVIKTASATQTTGSSSSSASNTILMQLYPVGNTLRVSLTIATSVPAQCLLSLMFYDY